MKLFCSLLSGPLRWLRRGDTERGEEKMKKQCHSESEEESLAGNNNNPSFRLQFVCWRWQKATRVCCKTYRMRSRFNIHSTSTFVLAHNSMQHFVVFCVFGCSRLHAHRILCNCWLVFAHMHRRHKWWFGGTMERSNSRIEEHFNRMHRIHEWAFAMRMLLCVQMGTPNVSSKPLNRKFLWRNFDMERIRVDGNGSWCICGHWHLRRLGERNWARCHSECATETRLSPFAAWETVSMWLWIWIQNSFLKKRRYFRRFDSRWLKRKNGDKQRTYSVKSFTQVALHGAGQTANTEQ